MAKKDLLATIRKNTTQAVTAGKAQAEEDRKAHAPTPAPAPVAPANDATVAAFRAQATANLTKTPAKGLLDTIGYGHSTKAGMESIKDEPAVKEGLGPIDAPILSQTPNDPQQREKQLAEFEKIKAGF